MPFSSIVTSSSAVLARLAELEQRAADQAAALSAAAQTQDAAMQQANRAMTMAPAASTSVSDLQGVAATKSHLTPLQQAATTASSTIASSEAVHATLQAEIDMLTKTKYWLASR